eukprot:6201106-Pleurochrysis_carterae.AAC.2
MLQNNGTGKSKISKARARSGQEQLGQDVPGQIEEESMWDAACLCDRSVLDPAYVERCLGDKHEQQGKDASHCSPPRPAYALTHTAPTVGGHVRARAYVRAHGHAVLNLRRPKRDAQPRQETADSKVAESVN